MVLIVSVLLAKAFIDVFVHRNVDTTYEETGDTRYFARVAACQDELLNPRQISFGNLFIDFLREQQCDIDINALADELLDRRQAGLCRRYLDHQVNATNRPPEPPRLNDRCLGAHREIRRDFEADITVPAFRRIVDGAQRIRRVPDIFHREPLVYRHDVTVVLSFEFLHGRIVISATGDGLFED